MLVFQRLTLLVPLSIILILISCNPDDGPTTSIEAEFSMSEEVILEGESIKFSDESTGEIASYQWTFQGGSPETSTDQNPEVIYQSDGFYDVTLEVTGENGKEVTRFREKAVRVDCNGSFCQPTYQVTKTTDLVYGSDTDKHVGWLYEPVNELTDRPVVLFFGGGGFSTGSGLNLLEDFAQLLASYGVVVATMKYRFAPHQPGVEYWCRVTEAQQDMRTAVRYFRKNATQFGIDPDKIFSGGNSSGAITAIYHAYASYDELGQSQIDLYDLCGGFWGADDDPSISEEVKGVISLEGLMHESMIYVAQNDPGIFLVCGSNGTANCDVRIDETGTDYGSIPIHARAKEVGLTTDLYIFLNGAHESPRLRPQDYMPRLMYWMRQVMDE